MLFIPPRGLKDFKVFKVIKASAEEPLAPATLLFPAPPLNEIILLRFHVLVKNVNFVRESIMQ